MEDAGQNQKNAEQKSEQRHRSNKSLLFVVILFIISLAVLFFSLRDLIESKQKEYNDNPVDRVYPNNSNSAGSQNGSLTQINGDQSSGVEVTAVYEKEKSQNQIFFKLYFNTHAVDYSNYDLRSNIVIKDLQGKEYKVVDVVKEGSGHHQSFEITFSLISPPFKLVVKNLAGVLEREFSF